MNPTVEELLKVPQFEQRTPEWYRQRENAITASDIPTVLGENEYKSSWSLLLDKCNANPKPFVGNSATKWGNHYEDIAIEKYFFKGKYIWISPSVRTISWYYASTAPRHNTSIFPSVPSGKYLKILLSRAGNIL
jgi:hypothetical protein